MPQTLAQKILQAHTDEAVQCDGQIVQCRVSMVLANDITGPLAIKSFRGMGAEKVFDKDRIALVEQELTKQISTLKNEMRQELRRSDEELRDKLDESVDPVESIVSELREKIAFNAGKYGGLVALVISLLMMLVQYILNHPIPKQP